MLVKLLVSRVGDNFSQIRGDEIELESAEAYRMIDAQQAAPLGEEAKAEYADYKAAKKKAAAKPKPQPKPEPKPESEPEPEENESEADGGDTPEGPTVDEIGLKEKHAKALRENGITTLAQLQEAGDLTQLDGIGKPTAQEIRDSVAAFLAR